MTEWQQMTDDERALHLVPWTGRGIDILSIDAWEASQQPTYARFTPRWEHFRLQEVDRSNLKRGVLLDGNFWMPLADIAAVRPHEPTVQVEEKLRAVRRDHLASHSAHVGDMVRQTLEDADLYEYDEGTGISFLYSALRMLDEMGYTRQDIMLAWDGAH